ncbi:TPA: hypothetical protein U1C85_001967 [Streptococcus suis]|nr:hypothetical protein [Streptococcus suis]
MESHERIVDSIDQLFQKFLDGGYTYPHYDKLNNCVRQQLDFVTIEADCLNLGSTLEEFWYKVKHPTQLTLF